MSIGGGQCGLLLDHTGHCCVPLTGPSPATISRQDRHHCVARCGPARLIVGSISRTQQAGETIYLATTFARLVLLGRPNDNGHGYERADDDLEK